MRPLFASRVFSPLPSSSVFSSSSRPHRSPQTFYANVSEFGALDSPSVKNGPVFQLEYSTRTAYDPNNTWPTDAPLNASFFHRMTENVSSIRCQFFPSESASRNATSVVDLRLSVVSVVPPAQMEKDHSLVELFTKHQGKSSIKTAGIQPCNTTECAEAKIC